MPEHRKIIMKHSKTKERLRNNPKLQNEIKKELNRSKPYFQKLLLDREVETRFLLKQKCFCLTETTDEAIIVYDVISFQEEVTRRLLKMLIPVIWD